MAFSQGPVSPSSLSPPRTPVLIPPHHPLLFVLGTGLGNPCLTSRRCPIGVYFTSTLQLAPDPEKGGMVMGSPLKPRLGVRSERSCGSGCVSPLLSFPQRRGAELGVAVVSVQILHDQSAAPGAQGPPQGEGQCRPVPRKESAVSRSSKGTKQLRTPAHPFPQPRGCLLYFPTHSGLPKHQSNGWWKRKCPGGGVVVGGGGREYRENKL